MSLTHYMSKSLRAYGLTHLLENHTLDQVRLLVTDNKETIDNTYREVQRMESKPQLSDLLRDLVAERDDSIVIQLYNADHPGIIEKAISELTTLKGKGQFKMSDLREWLRCHSAGISYEKKYDTDPEHQVHNIKIVRK